MPQFLVLVTVGAPDCHSAPRDNTDFEVGQISRLIMQLGTDRQVRTFVLGVTDPMYPAPPNGSSGFAGFSHFRLRQWLNEYAEAGGVPRNDGAGELYYRAGRSSDVVASLRAVAAGILTSAGTSCEFTLQQAPGLDQTVEVRLDGRSIAADSVEGWTFGRSREVIELRGSACWNVRLGAAQELEVDVTCGP